jgi:hypothetical protein
MLAARAPVVITAAAATPAIAVKTDFRETFM